MKQHWICLFSKKWKFRDFLLLQSHSTRTIRKPTTYVFIYPTFLTFLLTYIYPGIHYSLSNTFFFIPSESFDQFWSLGSFTLKQSDGYVPKLTKQLSRKHFWCHKRPTLWRTDSEITSSNVSQKTFMKAKI